MKSDVLLVVDGSSRELTGIMLLQYYLKKLGLSSRICSLLTLRHSFNQCHPRSVVLPNAGNSLCSALSERSFVFVMSSESGNGQRSQVRGTILGGPNYRCYNEYCDHFFSWGEQMTEWLIEDGAYSKDKISTTGHPATDHWLIKINRTPQKKIGLTTTFRALSNSLGGMPNAIEWIYNAELFGDDGTFYRPPQHAEVWIYWEAAFLRLICNIVEKIVKVHSLNLEIRPHPVEKVKPYKYLTKKSNGLVQIDKGGSISEWFEKINILFAYMSASALDAVVQGVPVVSLQNILNQDALKCIPTDFHYDYYKYFWQLNNLDQIKEFSDSAFSGNLPIAADEEGIRKYILRNFYYPREKPSSLLIAEKIKEIIENNKSRKFAPIGSGKNKYTSNLFIDHILNFYPELTIHAYYLYFKLNLGNWDPRFTYIKWKQRELCRAKQTMQKVINFYGMR